MAKRGRKPAKKMRTRRVREVPGTIKSFEGQTDAPTLLAAENFSGFMNQMQSYKRRTIVSQDSRSQVLLGLAEVLQATVAGVIHLGDMCVTAPNFNETQDIKTYPTE